MTQKEFLVIAKGLKAVYTDPKFLPDKDALDVWYGLLADLPYQVLTLAAQRYMMQETYPPTIAGLRQKAAELLETQEDSLPDMAAWALVRKALSNSIYHAEEEFARLPELCRLAVGDPANLKEMAVMDISTVDSVEQSHFLRNYRTQVERKKMDAQIAPGVRNMINNMGRGYLQDKEVKNT